MGETDDVRLTFLLGRRKSEKSETFVGLLMNSLSLSSDFIILMIMS